MTEERFYIGVAPFGGKRALLLGFQPFFPGLKIQIHRPFSIWLPLHQNHTQSYLLLGITLLSLLRVIDEIRETVLRLRLRLMLALT